MFVPGVTARLWAFVVHVCTHCVSHSSISFVGGRVVQEDGLGQIKGYTARWREGWMAGCILVCVPFLSSCLFCVYSSVCIISTVLLYHIFLIFGSAKDSF